jgi:hypothetical protein
MRIASGFHLVFRVSTKSLDNLDFFLIFVLIIFVDGEPETPITTCRTLVLSLTINPRQVKRVPPAPMQGVFLFKTVINKHRNLVVSFLIPIFMSSNNGEYDPSAVSIPYPVVWV